MITRNRRKRVAAAILRRANRGADDPCPAHHVFGSDCENFGVDCARCEVWVDCYHAKKAMMAKVEAARPKRRIRPKDQGVADISKREHAGKDDAELYETFKQDRSEEEE